MTLILQLRCQEPDKIQYQDTLKELLESILSDNEIEEGVTNEIETELSAEIFKVLETQQCPVQQLSSLKTA